MNPAVVGTAELSSPTFSSEWTLFREDELVCRGHRSDLRHPHVVEFDDGRQWRIERRNFDTIELTQDGVVLATATRTDPRGRWQIAGRTFSFDLRPESILRRRWLLIVGGQTVAVLRGGLLSFNRIAIDAALPVPLEGLWLAWAAIVHAWRAVGGPEEP